MSTFLTTLYADKNTLSSVLASGNYVGHSSTSIAYLKTVRHKSQNRTHIAPADAARVPYAPNK